MLEKDEDPQAYAEKEAGGRQTRRMHEKDENQLLIDIKTILQYTSDNKYFNGNRKWYILIVII